MDAMANSGIENPCPSRLTAQNQQRWTGQLLNCCEVSEVKERIACAMMPWSNVVLLCITYVIFFHMAQRSVNCGQARNSVCCRLGSKVGTCTLPVLSHCHAMGMSHGPPYAHYTEFLHAHVVYRGIAWTPGTDCSLPLVSLWRRSASRGMCLQHLYVEMEV